MDMQDKLAPIHGANMTAWALLIESDIRIISAKLFFKSD